MSFSSPHRREFDLGMDDLEDSSAATRGMTLNEEYGPQTDPRNRLKGYKEPLNGAVHTQNVQINGGHFTSIGGNMHSHDHNHTYYHFNLASPRVEVLKVDVLAVLKTVSNFRQIHQNTLSKATPRTGAWMLKYEEFAVWRDPKSGLNMMCGHGIPGAGKTVLTSIMINAVEERARELGAPICIGFIYIRYSDNAGLTVRDCLEVLVKQSVEQHSGCLQLAEDVYARHIRLETKPTEVELLQLLQRFAEIVAFTSYFLDALDEAPSAIQLDLVEKLSSTGAKLLITSRPMMALEERFPNAHHFSIAAQGRDLDLLIKDKLDSTRAYDLSKVLEHGGSALRETIASSIKRNCGDMFLHASLQLDALQECTNLHDLKETLADFPPRIEDVYIQTWRRITSQTSSKSKMAQSCLMWVFNSVRSMKMKELQHAAATDLETKRFDPARLVDKNTLVAICRGLVVFDEDTGLVRLVHYTAKETLERLIRETYPRLHSLMASFCIDRLNRHGFQCWRNGTIHSLYAVMDDDPLLSYAYHSWSIHARNSLNDPLTTTEVKDFVRGCRSFPIVWNFFELHLLGPLHVVAFFNLPISLAGNDWINIFNPNPRTTHQETPLHLACRHTSDFSALQELLAFRFVDVNAANKRKQTPLIHASQSGNVVTVKLLLGHPKIKLYPADEEGFTAFLWAARNGNKALVTAILDHSHAEVHSRDKLGRTALAWACQNGDIGMAELLLSYSCSEARLADGSDRTPLSWAAASKCIETLKLIISLAPDDVQLADEKGRTPLSWALSCGRDEAAEVLLTYLTTVNQADINGRTPLSWASENCRVTIVQGFLTHPDTDVNWADEDGRTALMWVFHCSPWGSLSVDTLKALLAHSRTNVNLPDRDGLTPLMWAARYSKAHSMEILENVLVIRDLPDGERQMEPCYTTLGREQGVKLLLAHPDININVQDNEGRTPLSWASEGNEKATRLLLVHPTIQVNLPDKDGRTPLIRASMQQIMPEDEEYRCQLQSIVAALLAHPQTDVSLADIEGWTALTWALHRGHNNIVKLLLEHPQIQVGPDHNLSHFLS